MGEFCIGNAAPVHVSEFLLHPEGSHAHALERSRAVIRQNRHRTTTLIPPRDVS